MTHHVLPTEDLGLCIWHFLRKSRTPTHRKSYNDKFLTSYMVLDIDSTLDTLS